MILKGEFAKNILWVKRVSERVMSLKVEVKGGQLECEPVENCGRRCSRVSLEGREWCWGRTL